VKVLYGAVALGLFAFFVFKVVMIKRSERYTTL
jgi:hypothetical protein